MVIKKTPKKKKKVAAKKVSKKKTVVKKSPKVTPKEKKFKVSIIFNDGLVVGSSNDVLAQAILDLQPNVLIKTKVILRVESEGKTIERYYLPRELKRPLIDSLSAEILADRLQTLLK